MRFSRNYLPNLIRTLSIKFGAPLLERGHYGIYLRFKLLLTQFDMRKAVSRRYFSHSNSPIVQQLAKSAASRMIAGRDTCRCAPYRIPSTPEAAAGGLQ